VKPTSFCSKKGGDAGTPLECKPGWETKGDKCFENCERGFGPFGKGSSCRTVCKSGTVDKGYYCSGGPTEFLMKSMYVREQIPLAGNTGCPARKYQQGSLCYWDCATIGLTNCGFGACSADTATCNDKSL